MRVCIDIRDPRQESPGAAPRDMRSSQDTSRPPKLRLAVPVEKKWSNGREVAVAFLDGHADLHQRVMAVADSWTEHANLTFEWDVPLTEADVRVTFAGAGSWSQGQMRDWCQKPSPRCVSAGSPEAPMTRLYDRRCSMSRARAWRRSRTPEPCGRGPVGSHGRLPLLCRTSQLVEPGRRRSEHLHPLRPVDDSVLHLRS